ncbi:MAG0920 family protein [Mycoplasmopsis hyopharyngis]|uniref:MAG0920 family protein n=1 Tax=Mycoplasmopsis hyopharyngis TaxID=29558 RepID=UPI0038732474
MYESNVYCKNKNLKVQEWLVDYYLKLAKRMLLISIVIFIFELATVPITIRFLFISNWNKNPWINSIVGLLLIYIFSYSLLIFSKIVPNYKKQKSWKRFNQNLDDRYLIEKTINPEATSVQLKVSVKIYKLKIEKKYHFQTYFNKNFSNLAKEEQKCLVYMNLVLNYDKTEFDEKDLQGYLSIDMFKDDAKMVGIVE